jgi:hypothetical protein
MLSEPFVVPAILFLVFSLPLSFNVVPRNRFWGIRTKKTMETDKNWYEVNQTGGIGLSISGAFYLLVAYAYPSKIDGDEQFSRWLVHLICFGLPLLLSGIAILSTSKKIRST